MRRRPMAAALGMVVAGVLAFNAGPAGAATVSIRPTTQSFGPEVAFVAAAGEANRVELRPRQVFEPSVGVRILWTVRDVGAVLHAGESCSRVDEHTALCERGDGPPSAAAATLGDLDDTLSIIPEGLAGGNRIVVDGGDGNDELTGAAFVFTNLLRGGPGDDHLQAGSGGGAFGDTLDGGPGNDRLIGGRGHDRLRGGGGRDEIRGGEGDDQIIDGDRDDGIGDAGPGPDI